MSQSYIWLHEDSLSLDHPVFSHAGEPSCAVFIWDDAYFERQNYSLKRLTFIYECLIGLQERVVVYQGDTETLLRNICADRKIYVADTPNPIFLEIIGKLAQDNVVEIVKDKPFINAPDDVDMTRFFRFWNRSRKSALGFE